jgi:hypothetical protein
MNRDGDRRPLFISYLGLSLKILGLSVANASHHGCYLFPCQRRNHYPCRHPGKNRAISFDRLAAGKRRPQSLPSHVLLRGQCLARQGYLPLKVEKENQIMGIKIEVNISTFIPIIQPFSCSFYSSPARSLSRSQGFKFSSPASRPFNSYISSRSAAAFSNSRFFAASLICFSSSAMTRSNS